MRMKRNLSVVLQRDMQSVGVAREVSDEKKSLSTLEDGREMCREMSE